MHGLSAIASAASFCMKWAAGRAGRVVILRLILLPFYRFIRSFSNKIPIFNIAQIYVDIHVCISFGLPFFLRLRPFAAKYPLALWLFVFDLGRL